VREEVELLGRRYAFGAGLDLDLLNVDQMATSIIFFRI
jgi:hypothetical protein